MTLDSAIFPEKSRTSSSALAKSSRRFGPGAGKIIGFEP